MAAMSSQPPTGPRTVLRKAAAQPVLEGVPLEAGSGGQAREPHVANAGSIQQAAPEPYCLLGADNWQVCPQAVAELLTANHEFSVVGVLGAQGLGKSAFLNRLLGFEGPLAAGGPHPTPAFPTTSAALRGRHCTRGVELRVSSDRIIALDTQPLFSASVLEDVVGWERPPAALAAPAVAAAGKARAAAVPFEGAQALAQLQLAVLLLTACQRVLVFCGGGGGLGGGECGGECCQRTWEFLSAAEMLARGVPDPSLPPREQQQQGTAAAPAPGGGGPSAAAAAATASAASASRQPQGQGQAAPPVQEHLAEVVLVHVLPGAGCGGPTAVQLQRLEQRLDAFFSSSRLRRPGPLRMLEHIEPRGSPSSSPSSSGGGGRSEGVGYWVLPPLPAGTSSAASSSGSWSPEEGAWAGLAAQLLARPPGAPFARRCSEQHWLRGVAGEVWRAARKSTDVATYYSRMARTVLKGAGGWALAQPQQR